MDPLDAFMEAAVNPEVVAAEKAEAARKAQLKLEQAQALAVCTPADTLAHFTIATHPANTDTIHLAHVFWLLFHGRMGGDSPKAVGNVGRWDASCSAVIAILPMHKPLHS